MNSNTPQVSVVIPAYNQAQYLAEAVESVLAQSYRDFEIIVVDDGSTDETPQVTQQFGQAVRYIHQENQGLAGARNTGILATQSEYVALLDSDDVWQPTFLEEMVRLGKQYPEAAVYYCGVQYMNEDGAVLPQASDIQVFPRDKVYQRMLRANFLVPSTILLRRSIAMTSGLFDVAFRRLQDWEFWIRLLKQGYIFEGLSQALVRYRLHGSSLSTDPVGGQKAALTIAEKHFGADDGQWQTWNEEKRRAYGGVYRYHALTSSLLRQSDWHACARYLRRAFQVDPGLAVDLDLFYEITLGTQPLGQRGAWEQLDIVDSAAKVQEVLGTIFETPLTAELELATNQAYGTAFYALGLAAYNSKHYRLSRRFFLDALRFWPGLWQEPKFMVTLVKSFLGPSMLRLLHQLRGSALQTTKETV